MEIVTGSFAQNSNGYCTLGKFLWCEELFRHMQLLMECLAHYPQTSQTQCCSIKILWSWSLWAQICNWLMLIQCQTCEIYIVWFHNRIHMAYCPLCVRSWTDWALGCSSTFFSQRLNRGRYFSVEHQYFCSLMSQACFKSDRFIHPVCRHADWDPVHLTSLF